MQWSSQTLHGCIICVWLPSRGFIPAQSGGNAGLSWDSAWRASQPSQTSVCTRSLETGLGPYCKINIVAYWYKYFHCYDLMLVNCAMCKVTLRCHLGHLDHIYKRRKEWTFFRLLVLYGYNRDRCLCSTGTTVTSYNWPTADTKLSVQRLAIVHWSKTSIGIISMCETIIWAHIMSIWWCLSPGWAVSEGHNRDL